MLLDKFLVFFLALTGLSCQVFAKRRFTDEEVINKIDSYVDGIVKCKNFTGATLAVVRNGKTLMTKGYGFANVRRSEPVSPDTKFAIASITKSFTSQLISKLITDKELDIDSKVKDFWAGFTAWSGYRFNDLTIRDFLAHKTGVPRNDQIWVLGGRDRDSLINKARLLEPIVSPRIQLLYNNIFYVLAGKVTEEIADTGDSWENLIEDNFFKVIGMNKTGFYDVQQNYDGFATPYGVTRGLDGSISQPYELPFETWSNVGVGGPAASIASTANDMARWLMTILNDGVSPDGKRVMQKESIDRVFFPEIAFNDAVPALFGNRNGVNRRTSYGLGYFNGYIRGVEFHQHGGDLTGYHSTHTLIRSVKSGYFFSTNYGFPGNVRLILDSVINSILLSEEPTIPLEEACGMRFSKEDNTPLTFTENTPQIPKLSALQVIKLSNKNATKYAGKYENWAYGTLSIKTTSGGLIQLTGEYGRTGRFNLYPLEDNVFVGESLPGAPSVGGRHLFTFSEEEQGKMKKVQTTFEPNNPPVFQRSLGPEPPLNHDKCED